jgi:2-polyprenyl-3-methyl-5-hydroxy-6-metoxy-1,4-benzoquinol methylase
MENIEVCPWWMGYMLLIPIRKIMHDPAKIVGPYLKPGMKVIDYGSAMGYFSIPMAKRVGEEGKVFCFDIQLKMIEKLMLRAKKSGVETIIEPKLITGSENDYEGMEQVADFALLFAVAHEVPDQKALFVNLYHMLKPGAFLYFGEPAGHVITSAFKRSISLAGKAGFTVATPVDEKKLTVVLQRT